MSALWVLALGASVGYLAFKRHSIESRLELAVKEWEGAGAEASDPKPPDGANFKEIKEAWRYTDDTRNRDFNERLPAAERAAYLASEAALEQEAHQFDGAQPPSIEGVYLEQIGQA